VKVYSREKYEKSLSAKLIPAKLSSFKVEKITVKIETFTKTFMLKQL